MDNARTFEGVAVFIDVENYISQAEAVGLPVILRPVIDRIREEGQIVFMRAYGDWSQPWVSRHLSEFRDSTIEMTELSASSYRKNTADMQLAVDALEMALQPLSPSVFVIVSGDRDFVPLVQKIKRYGKNVMGIGVDDDSTSHLLSQACNSFLFAIDILEEGRAPSEPPDATAKTADEATSTEQKRPASSQVPPEPTEAAVSTRQREALSLLARAVFACGRQGEPATEDNVHRKMRQMKSTFYPSRYGYSNFIELAEDAHRLGYARVSEVSAVSGVSFDLSYITPPDLLHKASTPERFDFSTDDSAVVSYRQILKSRKRLDLLPYSVRKDLVLLTWQYLEQVGDDGATFEQLAEFLREQGPEWIPAKAIELLIRTLLIGRCLESEGGNGSFIIWSARVRPIGTPEEALFEMHRVYLNGIRMEVPEARFTARAVAEFLYDEATESTLAQAKRLMGCFGGGYEGEETAMGEALKQFLQDSSSQ